MADKQTLNFANLKVEITQELDRVHYRVSGDIDENFRHKDVPRIRKSEICLHLKDAGHFNSCGIREWILFISDLSKFGKLSFHECSVSAIDQMNMVPNSLGGGDVISFYAPYYCQCGQEHTKLIQVREHEGNLRKLTAPSFTCECGRQLEFDALEESYFQFLTAMPQAS